MDYGTYMSVAYLEHGRSFFVDGLFVWGYCRSWTILVCICIAGVGMMDYERGNVIEFF